MISREKLKKVFFNPVTVFIAFFVFFAAVYIHFYIRAAPPMVKEANDSYLDGERAQTVDERKDAFNKALNAFLKLEDEYDPRFGNGILYYDIGNTFFQLEDYPRAVLYYYRSLKLRPFDENVQKNLNIALYKLDLPNLKSSSPIETVFFFHSLFPLPWRLQFFFITTFLAMLLASIYIWKPSEKVKLSSMIFGALGMVMLLSLTFTYFVENPHAVVVKSTNLYRGAGKQFAPVTDKPIKAGTKILVTELELEGKWLKVATPDGEVGFVPSSSLLLIF